MADAKARNVVIGSDSALTDPAHDAFGYAAFAQHIADAIRKTPSPQGLVMAIHGAWGSGKSTLLNFVKYDLAQLSDDERPIVIDFNPWWFDSREHLAGQFLLQFRSKLTHESDTLRAAGDKLAEYGSKIGSLIAGTYGVPWIDLPIGFFLKMFGRKPKDVPELKVEIANALEKAGQRFVFVVDDIDRLAPNEMRELFKVIKALADFPNVIYLLAFDRKVVADALNISLGIEGENYLEKLVQVPCSLPAVDRVRLRRKLFSELDRILESFPLRHFDQTYWGNVYFDGLDHYIRRPRDIVRVTNALCVTYPAVVGEVNPIDFVAIEFLRIFEPTVYGVIRDHRDIFVGHSDVDHRRDAEPERGFHNSWLEQVPAERRSHVRDLVERLFPKLESIWGNMHYGSDHVAIWRKEQRICCKELFEIYFQFGVSPDSLRRAELDELITAANQSGGVSDILKSASAIKRPDGSSKAREYLDRLHDVEDEITPEGASGLLTALLDIGDALLSSEDEAGGMTRIPNRWRLMWAVNHLFDRIPEEQRPALLAKIFSGNSMGLITDVVTEIEEYLEKPEKAQGKPLSQIDAETTNSLRSAVVSRLGNMETEQLLAIPDLDYVIHHWARWAGKEVVALRIAPIFASDKLLPLLLEKYLGFSTQWGWDDRVTRRVPRLNPKRLEVITDILELEPRVKRMLERPDLTANQRTAGEQFAKGMDRIRQGKNPDGFFRDD